MKVPSSGNVGDNDAVKITRSDQIRNDAAVRQRNVGTRGDAIEQEKSDTVTVGLGKLLEQELDPARMEDDRRKKIDKLKELIASGSYNPSSTDVAKSMVEELTMGILTEGSK